MVVNSIAFNFLILVSRLHGRFNQGLRASRNINELHSSCSCWLGGSNLLHSEIFCIGANLLILVTKNLYNIATWRLYSGFHVLKEILISCIVVDVGFVQAAGIQVVSIAANFFFTFMVTHIGQQILENFATGQLPFRVCRNTEELNSCSCSCSCGVFSIAAKLSC